MDRDPQKEANSRNAYLLKNAKGNLPSYCLWDEYSVGNPDTWNKWWKNTIKNKKKNK